MPASPKIIELRKILAERYPQQTGTRSLCTPTGWSPLDSLLGGGLPKGAITQLVIPNISSGGAIVLHEIIEAMHEASQYVALIDGKDCFEPARRSSTFALDSLQQHPSGLESDGLDSARWQPVVESFWISSRTRTKNSGKFLGQPGTGFSGLSRRAERALLIITRHPIVSSAQITISMTHRLCIDDLSTQRTDLVKFISLEIIRSRTQQEYRYA